MLSIPKNTIFETSRMAQRQVNPSIIFLNSLYSPQNPRHKMWDLAWRGKRDGRSDETGETGPDDR